MSEVLAPVEQQQQVWRTALNWTAAILIAAETDQPLAWFPEHLGGTDPSDRIWVGRASEYIVIIALEGRP